MTSSSRQRQKRGNQRNKIQSEKKEQSDEDIQNNPLPPKLSLDHNGRKIKVQCMFVEVKSANDRLDGRQEDWLNVLDRHGSARVCKFGSN
mmetsp:Transcript_1828/g.2698  ORF Transcript_1828/g.2698 Transcript_1828/m.2698 type:complete len:90 (+) Transcript_1828:163-432(+)